MELPETVGGSWLRRVPPSVGRFIADVSVEAPVCALGKPLEVAINGRTVSVRCS
jgi:hypothetical protein